MKNSRLKVLAGVFFVVFALLPPNVAATTYKVDAGKTDTDAYTGQTEPTAVVSDVPDSYTLKIVSGDTIEFFVNWTATDHDDTLGSLGSNHTHTLYVNPSDDDPIEKNIYRDLINQGRSGTITISYPNITSDTTYFVVVYCKVQDKDTGKLDWDTDSFTLTADVPPWAP